MQGFIDHAGAAFHRTSQCCSNTSKKKLHKKITCAMLAKHGCSDHSNLKMEAESLTKNLS